MQVCLKNTEFYFEKIKIMSFYLLMNKFGLKIGELLYGFFIKIRNWTKFNIHYILKA